MTKQFKKKAAKRDVYVEVTNKVVALLEEGVRPWHKPWNTDHLVERVTRPIRHNGEAYHGINVLVLWMEALANGYAANQWMTYRQAQALGAQVQRGQKGTTVVYANKMVVTESNDEGEDEIVKQIPYLKTYTVFNVDQIEGLPKQKPSKPVELTTEIAPRAQWDAFFHRTGARIQHGGNKAYYSNGHNVVQMPPIQAFEDATCYYATLAHELTHWTRHETRLDRSFGRKRYGDEGYAMEELVAELGAAFLCADLGITPETREDHAAYIDSWLKVLGDNPRAIFTAAAHAERAVAYLHDCQ